MGIITTNGGKTISNLLDDINLYKYNPSGIQRVVLEYLRAVTDGKVDIVDPTNPFVFLLEASSVNTAAAMIENEINTRKQYPAAAQTLEDIYIHMSDVDFIDRFAKPVSTMFSMMIQKNDLIGKMVLDPVTNNRKVTIARNTEFTVAETTFSLQYPINIVLFPHGGLRVMYDADIVSPLQNLQTNNITSNIRTDSAGIDWLYFEFEVTQFKINSNTFPITSSTSLNQTLDLTDNYYYSRVYYQSKVNPNKWTEIYTTHTDQVYDPVKPTAVLKVLDKTLTVSVPQVYLNTGLIQGTLRVDVYETKGELVMMMDNYPISSFVTNIRSIDKFVDSNDFTAAMNTVNFIAYSTKTIAGGGNALTFEQIRTRVINNSIGNHNLPITNVQIESSLENKGYQIVKNVDVVTNRVFLATKPLPVPFDEKLITSGSASIETFVISMKDAVNQYGVKDNGLRITFTPEIIYKNISGIISIFPKNQLDELLNTGPDNIANNVTNNDYLYSPFHYVMDTASSEFEVRPYYLDDPKTQFIRFISQNETTGLQVNTQSYFITKKQNGFTLSILTKSNKEFIALNDENVFVQLSFVPVTEEARAYLTGKLVNKDADGERVYEFDITTNYDIDSKDNIIFNSFKMFTNDVKLTGSSLTNEFDILYSTNSKLSNTWIPDASDLILGKFLLPDQVIGITNEKINILFGYSLKTLWARSRSVVASAPFLKYTEDIPWVYENDVYATDPNTGTTFSFDAEGNIKYTILHSKGDPVLDQNYSPLFKHQVGEIMLDSNGLPIPSDVLAIVRQVDMMFIEGSYYFATDSSAATYRTDMVNTVIDWLTNDLTTMSGSLLEQTRLYFYPKKSMGQINAIVDDGKVTTIEAGQYFKVQLYVSKIVYEDTELRNVLTNTTIKVIDNLLKSKTIAISGIISELMATFGSDVVGVKVTGLGGTRNLETITITNDSDRCSIRKRLVKLPDGKLIVQEDIDCSFINYQQNII